MRRKTEEEKKEKLMKWVKWINLWRQEQEVTSSIIETMMNIRTTSMSMKTLMKKRRRKTEEEKKEKLMKWVKWINVWRQEQEVTLSIIETMMNIRTTSMSMKTVMKKRRRKTEEEKKEKLMKWVKWINLWRQEQEVTSSRIETMMNIRTTSMSMKTLMKKRRRKTEEEKREKLMKWVKWINVWRQEQEVTSSIIETMMNIRTTSMSMKTVMKKRRRKTEEEKKERLMKWVKWINLWRQEEEVTSSIIETMTNIRITPMSMKTVMRKRRRKTEEEKKEKLINMSKMKKLMKTREIADFEYNRHDDEY